MNTDLFPVFPFNPKPSSFTTKYILLF